MCVHWMSEWINSTGCERIFGNHCRTLGMPFIFPVRLLCSPDKRNHKPCLLMSPTNIFIPKLILSVYYLKNKKTEQLYTLLDDN